MIYEVAAAVEHIVSLVSKTIGAESLAGFSSTLKDELETRCQECWLPSDPEHGSAKRAVHWQLHAAGEGADAAILTAISSVLAAQSNVAASRTTRHEQTVALALQWLPHSFTLWIDPGCVAVRLGTGPGSSSGFFDANTKSTSSWSASTITVVWGAHSALAQHKPTVSSIQFPTTANIRTNISRPIPIVRPAASVQPRSYQHQRSVSTCSTASSVSASVPGQGLTRSVSLSSTSTASTEATSYSIGLASNDKCMDDDADVESDAPSCPHLTSPSEMSTASSNVDDEVDDTTVGNVTATRFPGARLFDALDEQDDAGDVTLGAADRTLLPGAIIATSSTPKRVGKVLPKPTAPLPTKSNYTTHDNGNVGVLGGGVRLGGMPAKPNAAPAPRYRQHSHSHSLSNAQQPFYAPQQQFRAPQYYPMGGHYSVPARTVPLPAPQHCMQQPMRMPMQHYGSVPHLAMAYNEHAFQHGMPRPAVSFALPAPGELLGEDGGDPRRRVRSRGRRSRGRGAGRAARRLAAAQRTGEDVDVDDADLDCDSDAQLTDADSNYSRCSTPATTSSASDYFASPAKPTLYPAAPHIPAFAMPMAV